MLSTLPKLADRNFVLGFFLPALFGIIAAAWGFPNLTLFAPLHALSVSDKEVKDLLYLALTTWLTAVLLMTVNFWIYRLYEGYTFPLTWIPWVRHYKVCRWRRLTKGYHELFDQYSAANDKGLTLPAEEMTRLIKLGATLHSDFPTRASDVLPTSFGNRIRAFEVYSRDVYGADSIPVWDRLISVIPKTFMESINDSRAHVDFYLNTSFIALCFFLIQIAAAIWQLGWDVRGCTRTTPLAVASGLPLVTMGASLMIAVLSYQLASHAVLDWGRSVKSAFDCFLPSLLTQLGYDIPSAVDRKTFWTEFSRLATYGDALETIWRLRAPDAPTTTETTSDAGASDPMSDDGPGSGEA